MHRKMLILALAACFVPALPAASWAQAQNQDGGSIAGTVEGMEGEPVPGVFVEVSGEGEEREVVTDAEGEFRIIDLPTGSYVVSSFGASQEVTVRAGETTEVTIQVEADLSFVDNLTVSSASRRAERITEAPAAVTVIGKEEIAREASHGQVPKLLEFTPGAEVTQSGIYDYNFNTRGFNSSLNRRVATLIDGRDPSVPFLGAQEWAAVSFPLDDLQSAELVRGPSAALYGSNASSGVLNLTTKSPRSDQTGTFRLTGGELNTINGDLRWATELGSGWYTKVVGGYRSSEDFSRSRTGGQAEYSVPCAPFTSRTTDCLPQEATPILLDENEILFGGLRFDKYIGESNLLTLEGGYAELEGPVFQTGIGRVQLTDVTRPWARVNFNAPRLNILGYYNGREANDQRALASNTPLYLDTENYQIEVQTNWEFLNDRARFVGGASYGEEDIDSANPAGQQTLVFRPISADFSALFGQFDFDLGSRVKLVLAARYDESSLHDDQFSPKGSLVWGLSDNHSVRLTYNEAFQVANYSEFFLQANAAVPVNLQPFEGFCAPFGVSCGFAPGPTRVLALGNEDLEVEETKTIELGYTGILGGRSFLTVDYYQSQNENFITDLLPQFGTSLGQINPNFGAYTPPSELPAPVQQALLAALRGALGPSFFILSNNLDGTPILVGASYTNFGEVDTQGIDIGYNHYASGGWRFNFTYSWFDFDIKDGGEEFENILLPNSPEHKVAGGVAYVTSKYDLGLNARWVDDFRWSVGPFQGEVESYTTVDLSGNYRINDTIQIGLNVANLLDNEHWEAFGGDLLGRRALANVAIHW